MKRYAYIIFGSLVALFGLVLVMIAFDNPTHSPKLIVRCEKLNPETHSLGVHSPFSGRIMNEYVRKCLSSENKDLIVMRMEIKNKFDKNAKVEIQRAIENLTFTITRTDEIRSEGCVKAYDVSKDMALLAFRCFQEALLECCDDYFNEGYRFEFELNSD